MELELPDKLLIGSSIVIGFTQIIKNYLKDSGISTKSIPLIAVIIGGIVGFCLENFQLHGLGWGLVMGMTTAGAVGKAQELADGKTPAVEVSGEQVVVSNPDSVQIEPKNE